MTQFLRILTLAAMVFSSATEAAPIAYDPQAPMIEAGELLLDPAMTAEDRAFAETALKQAKANIVQAYGEMQGDAAQVLWCATEACVLHFAGTDSRAYATPGGRLKAGTKHIFDRYTIVLPHSGYKTERARNKVISILTHELSHVEMRTRVRNRPMPAWFNEGLATFIGKEHDCAPGVQGIDSLARLERGDAWLLWTNRDKPTLVATYCQASNELAAWMADHGGMPAILRLLSKRAWGEHFDSLYGRLHKLVPQAASGPAPASDDAQESR